MVAFLCNNGSILAHIYYALAGRAVPPKCHTNVAATAACSSTITESLSMKPLFGLKPVNGDLWPSRPLQPAISRQHLRTVPHNAPTSQAFFLDGFKNNRTAWTWTQTDGAKHAAAAADHEQAARVAAANEGWIQPWPPTEAWCASSTREKRPK
jgi:hypothetical protein